MVKLSNIDKKIKELITILEKEEWTIIDFEAVGTLNIQISLHKPKYRYLKTKDYIQLYDKITGKKVAIDIITARKIEINEALKEYEILLDNGQYIKMKMY